MNKYELPIFEDLLKMDDPKGIISLFKEAGFKIPKDNYNEIIITQREFWLDSIINVIGKNICFRSMKTTFTMHFAQKSHRLQPWDEWALTIQNIVSSSKNVVFPKLCLYLHQ